MDRARPGGGREPFSFDERPPVRFFLLQAPDTCDLVILCHHFICDGFSLAFVARDILEHLGDPSRSVEVLPDPTPIDLDSIPEGVSLNPLMRFAIRRINRKWMADPVFFDQRDYEGVAEGYWREFDHQLVPIELSEPQTSALVERCRNEGVTVNTALAAAFTGAQAQVLDKADYHPNLAVAADLRDRLREPAGQAMGFYAGAVTLEYTPNPRIGFWENARALHARLQERYTDKTLFKEPLTWSRLEPSILEAINFKKLGKLADPDVPANRKLHDFAQREDVVLAILKRDKAESLERPFMGTALTNLGRMDVPTSYGPLVLERLFMKPGGAFPLVNLNLLVGAATVAGRLSLALEYVENRIIREDMEVITEQALTLLGDGT